MEFNTSNEQRKLLNILPRIAAGISLCCAIYMIWTILRSKYYRSRIYHRIMLGMAFNTLVSVLVVLWGSAAAPQESNNLGASGNQATCTAQGFLHYFSSFITNLYYCALSVLCYITVRQRFQYKNILWVEKYIHGFVVLMPLSIALYVLSVEGYNYVHSGCAIASVPVGCGDSFLGGESGESCTRGPQNIAQLQFFLVMVPGIIILLTPLIVMALLCLHVSCQSRIPHDVVVSVILQSAVYLLVMIAIYSFRIVDVILIFFGNQYSFSINLLANTNEALIGVWILLSYLYFRSEKKGKPSSCPFDVEECDCDCPSSLKIDVTDQIETEDIGSMDSETSMSSSSFFKKPSFSIFDGSDVTTDSPWAKFLTEGVDEEYEEGKVWRQ